MSEMSPEEVAATVEGIVNIGIETPAEIALKMGKPVSWIKAQLDFSRAVRKDVLAEHFAREYHPTIRAWTTDGGITTYVEMPPDHTVEKLAALVVQFDRCPKDGDERISDEDARFMKFLEPHGYKEVFILEFRHPLEARD